jgi:hypothetical protein
MGIKATIFSHCLPRSPDVDYECEDIHIDVMLPFVPQIGTDLKVTKNADYIAVESVSFDASKDGEGLTLHLAQPDVLLPWSEMQNKGWQLHGD